MNLKTIFFNVLFWGVVTSLLALPMIEEDGAVNSPAGLEGRAGADARARDARAGAGGNEEDAVRVQQERDNVLAVQEELPAVESNETQLINAVTLERATRTMACLRAIDAVSSTEISSPLFSSLWNRGDRSQAPLILNKGEVTYTFLIPAFGDQGSRDLAATIVPVGFKLRTSTSTEETIVPRRVPTAEENRQVRSLIKEALNVYYGSEFVEQNFSSIDAPENRNNPFTVAMVQGLDFRIGGDPTRDIEVGGNHPELAITADIAQRFPVYPPMQALVGSFGDRDRQQLADALSTIPMNEIRRDEYQRISDQIDDSLTVPPHRYLGRALWHSAKAGVLYARLSLHRASIALLIVVNPTVIGGVAGLSVGAISSLWSTPQRVWELELCNKLPRNINRTYDNTDHYNDSMHQEFVSLQAKAQGNKTTGWNWTDLNATSYEQAIIREFILAPYRTNGHLHESLLIQNSNKMKENMTPFLIHFNIDCNRLIKEKEEEEKKKADEYSYATSGAALGFILGTAWLAYECCDSTTTSDVAIARAHGDPRVQYYDIALHQANEAYAHYTGQYIRDALAPMEQAQRKDSDALTKVNTILADRDNDDHALLRSEVRESVARELQRRIDGRSNLMNQIRDRSNPSRVRVPLTTGEDDVHQPLLGLEMNQLPATHND